MTILERVSSVIQQCEEKHGIKLTYEQAIKAVAMTEKYSREDRQRRYNNLIAVPDKVWQKIKV